MRAIANEQLEGFPKRDAAGISRSGLPQGENSPRPSLFVKHLRCSHSKLHFHTVFVVVDFPIQIQSSIVLSSISSGFSHASQHF